ncbi:unnamed protein product [Closterium sp. NIES-53]
MGYPTTAYTNSTAAFSLVTELVDFAARSRLHYFASLGTESESVCPPSVGGEPALSSDVLEDSQFELECVATALPCFASMLLCPEGDPDALGILTPRSYAEAIVGEYSSQWQTAMDAEMASWKSTGTYIDEIPSLGAKLVNGMWIFKVKQSPGSPPAFKVRYVAVGFSQRQGVEFFQTFSPTPKMTTLWVLLHVAAERENELHSLDFSTAFLQGSLHEEIWLRRPTGFTGSFPVGTLLSLWRPVYGLRQAPREWYNTLRTTLAALGFAPSSADPSLFLRTDTTLPPFYVLVYVDNLVFAIADTEALALVKAKLQERHACTDMARTARAPPANSLYSLRAAHTQPIQHAQGPRAARTARAKPSHSPYSPCQARAQPVQPTPGPRVARTALRTPALPARCLRTARALPALPAPRSPAAHAALTLPASRPRCLLAAGPPSPALRAALLALHCTAYVRPA